MTLDPNWLYSATAQSAAAIVAIIGGFITSRVLMLNAEKRSLNNQYEQAMQRMSLLKQQAQEARKLHQTKMAKKFLWAIQDDLQKQPLQPLDELVRCHPGWDLDHEALENEYNAVLQDGLPRQTPSEMYRRDMEDKQFETDETWLADLQHEAYFVEREAKRLRSQVDSFAYPKNLVWGFAILGYLALVGVVYPLVLLPAGIYSPVHKNLVVWLFASGLGALLIYIATQIRELLRK